MALDLNAVMDGLGVRLATIAGLRVFDFFPDSVSPPAAVVGMPEQVEYDLTMRREADRTQILVHVLVGKASDRNARDRLSDYVKGSGALSVKTAIEADRTLGGVADSVRVRSADINVMTVAGMEFLAASFDVDIVG